MCESKTRRSKITRRNPDCINRLIPERESASSCKKIVICCCNAQVLNQSYMLLVCTNKHALLNNDPFIQGLFDQCHNKK